MLTPYAPAHDTYILARCLYYYYPLLYSIFTPIRNYRFESRLLFSSLYIVVLQHCTISSWACPTTSSEATGTNHSLFLSQSSGLVE